MPYKKWTEVGQCGRQEAIEEAIVIVQAREDDGKGRGGGCGDGRQWQIWGLLSRESQWALLRE